MIYCSERFFCSPSLFFKDRQRWQEIDIFIIYTILESELMTNKELCFEINKEIRCTKKAFATSPNCANFLFQIFSSPLNNTNSPRAASFTWNQASWVQYLMSAKVTIFVPPPTQGPWIAAITGLGH